MPRKTRSFPAVLTVLSGVLWVFGGCRGIDPPGGAQLQPGELPPIDRKALVTRHNPVVRELDVDAALTIGNGGFAFGSDITGLQTFSDHYHRHGVPTETQSRWCWVSSPNPEHYTLADAGRDFLEADGRTVRYPTRQSTPAGQWLRRNPRSHPLGQVRLTLAGDPLTVDAIGNPEQTLDLWRGIITSRYTIDGVPVEVDTACHPEHDAIAVRIRSDLLTSGRLRVELAFPRGHDPDTKNTPALDWSHPESHTTEVTRLDAGGARLRRIVEETEYDVALAWAGEPGFSATGEHRFELGAGNESKSLEFTLGFHPVHSAPPLASGAPAAPTGACNECEVIAGIGTTGILAASAQHWERFWMTGAAVDFSGSSDPRARKLEERIILSRYLMAVQMAGEVPPQESGLTCNTWYGKHHTEMIWWHAAHFPLWGHDELLARNLDWYRARLPEARALAESRGLEGARWAKMVGPRMRESPGGNPLIVWNQPHMIYLCELLYRNEPAEPTLDLYRDLVLETADCLASMVHFNEDEGVYVLGPPLWIAQEIYDQASSQNPSFELAYWKWALETAQRWRERLGLERDEHWDHVIRHLAPLPRKDGRYVALGSHPDTWDTVESRHDHPSMLAPLGLLPGTGVDRATMERTLDAVLENWDWETKIWGWDYPMIAMTATRLGRPETAVDILLTDGVNNRYLPNGHCPQRSDQTMPADPAPGARKHEIAAYLPANGALLSTVALMVAGWDGCDTEFPGFPKDGTWTVRAEGVRPLP